MKRFWRDVTVEAAESGHQVWLDGRPLRTPARNLLTLPREGLALEIAGEWGGQRDEVEPATMPLTRLASTVLDRLPARRAAAIDEVLGFVDTDLLCYRADQPVELVARQSRLWQPLLDWVAAAQGCRLDVTTGLLPVSQPEAARLRLGEVVQGLDDWQLVGLHALVTALGSIVLGLALHAGRIDPAGALDAALVDERFAIERWGEDAEQTRRHDQLRADVAAAARLLALLRQRSR